MAIANGQRMLHNPCAVVQAQLPLEAIPYIVKKRTSLTTVD
jgi:hypothetical protein